MKTEKNPLNYKWVVLVLCFLMEFVCMGFCSSNGGLYTKAITEALHIRRSIYSLSTSIRYGVQVFIALNFGAIVKRFGLRRMAGFGMLCLVCSTLIRSAATNVFHIYAGCALWGAGVVFAGGTMASTIVRRWFKQDVGRYTGIVMSSNGLGGALAAQIISPLINSGDPFGYRKAYLLASVLALVVGAVVVTLLREAPDGEAGAALPEKKKNRGTLWEGIPYDVLKKKPYFYLTAALVFLTGISLHSASNSTLVFMQDVGLTPEFVAIAATTCSLCLCVSKVLIGVVYDKKGLRFTLLMCQLAAIFCFFIYAMLQNTAAGRVMAITATVLECFALSMETVMIPLISNDLFGSAAYDKVLGIFTAMNSLGLCLGAPLGDLCYDTFGSYRPCFWFFTGLLVIITVVYHLVISTAYRDKKALLRRE